VPAAEAVRAGWGEGGGTVRGCGRWSSGLPATLVNACKRNTYDNQERCGIHVSSKTSLTCIANSTNFFASEV